LKRALDIAVAVAALVVTLPIFLMVAVLVPLDSPGPVLYRQRRIGRSGREFRMLKFRSMVVGAERIGTGLYSYADDVRVTRVGHWIRRLSIDELPQLLNVLAGEMSIVGPRPPVYNELGPYEGYSEPLRERMQVNPGITGLAQVSGRNDLDWDQKLVFDLEYIRRFRRWGVLEDLRIIGLTMRIVLTGSGVIEPRR
jgi:undecaprenyl phosphate N,N'-diacetylbacillosamine 1-phosphate transferase